MSEYMQSGARLYGPHFFKPKSHWAFDVADQMETSGFLFDAFIIERLHLRVRAIAENVKDTRTFGRAVLSGVVNVHTTKAKATNVGFGLVARQLLSLASLAQ